MSGELVVGSSEVDSVVPLRHRDGLAPLVACLVELVEEVVPATRHVQLLCIFLRDGM